MGSSPPGDWGMAASAARAAPSAASRVPVPAEGGVCAG